MSPNAPDDRDEPQELQFDRMEMTQSSGDPAASPGVTCVVCGMSVGASYYTANGKPICERCRDVVTSTAAPARSPGALLLAGLFGLGAAVAGAAIYYAVIAIANLEIGIVAILIGYMVGWAVRKGAGGRGGRRFQILAVVLTYWAVGLAYAPLAFKGMAGDTRPSAETVVGDSIVQTGPVQTGPGGTNVSGAVAARMAGPLLLLVFVLPVGAILRSLPFGLISALIIFIGMRQAWQMTAAPRLAISGP